MLKNFLSFFFIVLLSSCSSWDVKWKKGYGPDANVKTKPKQKKKVDEEGKIIDEKPVENWAKEYYQKTLFVIQNPKLLETKEDLDKICESPNKWVTLFYQDQTPQKISFKRKMVTFTTKDGFSKKVYVSKGACRELTLYKNRAISSSKQIRKSIAKVVLSYIYNEGTYLKEIEFKTPFRSVKFIVE